MGSYCASEGTTRTPNARRRLLVVDPARPSERLQQLEQLTGRQVDLAHTAVEAASWIGMRQYSAVIVALEGPSAIDLLRIAARRAPDTALVLVTRGPSLAAPMESSIHDRLVATVGYPWRPEGLASQLERGSKGTHDLPSPLAADRGALLLLEDDDGDAILVQEHVSAQLPLWSVERVSRLSDACKSLERQRFDVILTDLSLPDARGLDAVVRLRAAADAPMVVLSGAEDERLAVEALRAGAQDFIGKSTVETVTLSRAIRYAQERKRLELDLRRLANLDPLTQLANRSRFEEHLTRAVATARRSGRGFGILYIDLDHFKAVNDTLGHESGDALLVEVGRRLAVTLRDTDLAARLGGDELAVFLETETPEQALQTAERIRAALCRPYGTHPVEQRVTASVGIAMYRDGTTAEAIIAAADRGMYRSKRSGGNAVAFEASEELSMSGPSAADVRAALEMGELRLHYQPQFDADECAGSAEALLRWVRPDGTIIRPDAFLPVLEASNEMVAVGTWVLHTACQDIADWMRRGSSIRRVAVNVSARQLDDETLVAAVGHALTRCGLDPSQLELEVTESAVMRSPEHAARILSDLSKQGVRIAMDDFGTGYSSLAHLHRLPFDLVKIDRAFIMDMHEPKCATIIRAILALARELRLETVAEGVETLEQARLLIEEGCDQLQGYYLSRPMPTEDLLKLTREASRRKLA